MANTKKNPKKMDDKGQTPSKRQPNKWETAVKVVTHQPPALPAREDGSGNVSYTGICSKYTVI